MTAPATAVERDLLVDHLREAYMEVFPSPGIEQKLQVLQANSYVAVTCSPTKGVAATLDLTGRLIDDGFRVVPHIAAKNVRDRKHLRDIMRRLAELNIESLFVPGGDRSKPLGEFSNALQLLQAIDRFEHDIREIGIAAHPEGHPAVPAEIMLRELERKQPYATYLVTQMCFDADVLGRWLQDIRSRGISLPAWIGLPGAIDRSQLLATSLRIGVGDSLRFLRSKPAVATLLMSSSQYRPDELLGKFSRYQADPAASVAGYHLFCFNQVANTEQWRNDAIEALQ